MNVQVILEKLGGGGHMTVAGAQLQGVTVEEAKANLLERLMNILLKSTDKTHSILLLYK